MRRFTRFGRWTARGLRVLALGAALAVPAALAHGQTPGSSPYAAPKKTYTKNLSFDLPILMDDATRATLREVCLYVKTPTGNWTRQESAAPHMTRFAHKVPQDGEYWFSLVTVDKQGKMTPSDVNTEPPGLRVVVDTAAPTLQVQPWTGSDGDVGVRCTIQDANPDPASVKVVLRSPTGDVPLEAVPNQPGTFRVRPEQATGMVRVSATDLAGNSASREVSLAELGGGVKVAANMPTMLPNLPPASPKLPATELPAPTKEAVAVTKDAVAPMPKMLPQIVSETVPAAAPVLPPTLPPVLPQPAQGVVVESQYKPPTMLPLDPTSKSGSAQKQLINTTRANVDYRIDQVGPSGVGKVEVYMTTDQGMSWHRLCEDTDRRTPADLELPGEGLFGIRLAITNGNGFGGTPPARGDTPHCWIEVDTTCPFVQFRSAELVGGNGALEIRWAASDKNLGHDCVSLFYRTRPDGTWQPIARGLKNDGTYRWSFPREAGSQFYFKVEVVDQAGNVGRAESATPVVLDMTEPRASVVGVSGTTSSATRATAPNAN
jgi:hypothetical protein